MFFGEWSAHATLHQITVENHLCQIIKLTPTDLTCTVANEVPKSSSYLFHVAKGNSAIHTIRVTLDQQHILSKRADPESDPQVYQIDPVAATGGILKLYGRNPGLFSKAEIENTFYPISYSGSGELFQVYIARPMKTYIPTIILYGPTDQAYRPLDITFLRKYTTSTVDIFVDKTDDVIAVVDLGGSPPIGLDKEVILYVSGTSPTPEYNQIYVGTQRFGCLVEDISENQIKCILPPVRHCLSREKAQIAHHLSEFR